MKYAILKTNDVVVTRYHVIKFTSVRMTLERFKNGGKNGVLIYAASSLLSPFLILPNRVVATLKSSSASGSMPRCCSCNSSGRCLRCACVQGGRNCDNCALRIRIVALISLETAPDHRLRWPRITHPIHRKSFSRLQRPTALLPQQTRWGLLTPSRIQR